jgi:four helix bundle protein
MNDRMAFQRLDVYVAAKELARQVHEAQVRDAELRDQATRASKSTFLGLCEGLPSDSAGIRRRHFEIANNSLHEVVGAIDLAETIGVIDGEAARAILALRAERRPPTATADRDRRPAPYRLVDRFFVLTALRTSTTPFRVPGTPPSSMRMCFSASTRATLMLSTDRVSLPY